MPQQEHHSSQEVATSFDELAKGLANGTLSRGKAIRLVGGALLGAALASVPGVAWADDRCSEGQTRCGDRCVNLQRNERHCGSCFHRCAEGEECVSGVCQGSCLSNGGSCTSGSECCSGNCKGGTCVASCIPPSVTPCESSLDCGIPCGGCGEEVSGGAYCGGSTLNTPCTTSCDCPTDQFCRALPGENLCTTVCTPSTP